MSDGDSSSHRSSSSREDEQSTDMEGGASMDEEGPAEVHHSEHKENGNAAYRAKDYRGAIAHYTLAIEAAREELQTAAGDASGGGGGDVRRLLASYFGNRAAGLTMILRHRDALDDCASALEVDPTFSKAHVRAAKLKTAMGDLDGAKAQYSLALARGGDANDSALLKAKEEVETLAKRHGIAADMLGRVRSGKSRSLSRRDATQALRQIDLVLAACPEWDAATLIRVEALLHVGRADEAYGLTTKLLRRGNLGSSNSDLLLLRASCLFRQGKLDDAVKHLRQILQGDPDNREAMTRVKELRALGRKKDEADCAYKAKDFAGAAERYGEALDLCPTGGTSDAFRSKLYFNRASANAARRQHREVVADCTRALELDDEYLKAVMRRAASYLMLGETEDCEAAIRDYERAAELARTEEQERDVRKKLGAAQIQLKRSKRKDFYKILGVSKDANEAEIKKAYRKLALKVSSCSCSCSCSCSSPFDAVLPLLFQPTGRTPIAARAFIYYCVLP